MRFVRESVQRCLLPLGFSFEWELKSVHDILFARANSTIGVYERLRVHGCGREGQIVHADAEISIVKTQYSAGYLVRDRILPEVALDAENGSAISTRHAADRFAERLAQIGSRIVSEFATTEGPSLLSDTFVERQAADHYVRLGKLVWHSHPSLNKVRTVTTPIQHELADRILNVIGVGIPEADDVYLTAILTVLKFYEDVEGVTEALATQRPLVPLALRHRIEIVVERILAVNSSE